ncbi:GNAT family N-acetyltransferase [Microbulbifer rhizosphaerae]|uniref:GNAT superfamily N-acetyltransferase n=1 Tax=Microbulbifer rhizosphaerae TaxID=1562603 RepID=A0A7W4W7T2_9GAMM|nr:GNAT family N-acetyltransferase [Microbulbifer rhizosphaerae]MBB3059221.1 GNAT superfamily N-acetyltransferase [Microbulbifer rhizosphaerae]
MQNKDYSIKSATRKEVDIAISWAAAEGWNPGIYDADCYYTADPRGFLIGFLDEEPIATISVVKYSDTFGFLGFYIVKPEYRGHGYGLQIWNAGLQYLRGCNVGLDGVVAQQDSYKKSGFRLAFRNRRYEGVGGGDFPINAEIVKLSSLPFETIAAYDRPFFPADRSHFIKAWIEQPECTALGIRDGGKLAGYGVLRKCRSGYKIGPLFADDPELAESLFLALRSAVQPSEPLYLDVPEINPAAVDLAKRYNMNVVFETARMYKGPEPDMPVNRIFGITSFEIG